MFLRKNTLTDCSHSTRSPCARFSVASAALLRTCAARSSENNPNRKTLLEVIMSMMTSMTTVLHRDFENDWSNSPFSTVQVACIQGFILVFTALLARPCIGLCSNAFLQDWQRNSSFPTLRLSNSSMSDCVYPCS